MLRSRKEYMKFKRTATIVVVGGAFAAWLSAAIAPMHSVSTESSAVTARPVDARADELAKEIARLQSRLRPDAAPNESGRNLFEFRRSHAESPAGSIVAPPPIAPPPVVALPPLTLAGIAEDSAASGTI